MGAFDSARGREAAQKPRITKKAQRFRKQFMQQMWEDPEGAAKRAGYPFPHVDGPRLVEKLSDLIAADKDAFRQTQHMDAVETIQLLSLIGRGQKSNMVQVRALELLCRIHALIGDTMTLRFDRKEIEKELDSRTTALLAARKPLALPEPKDSQ